jgi:hypothetical protein
MTLTDWIAFGMGTIMLVAIGALFWKLTSSH